MIYISRAAYRKQGLEVVHKLKIMLGAPIDVEAVDKDADHLSITALTRSLNVDLSIAYLDLSTGHFGHGDAPGSQDSDYLPVDFHRFESQNADAKDLWSKVAFLYRYAMYFTLFRVKLIFPASWKR